MMRQKGYTNNDQSAYTNGWQVWWDSGLLLQQALGCSGIGFVLLEESSIILRTNNSFSSALRYPGGELEGKLFTGLLHPDDSIFLMQQYDDLQIGEPQHSETVLRCLRFDGEYHWFRALLCATRIDIGEGFYYSILLEDIHKWKQAEEENVCRIRDCQSIIDNSSDLIVRYNLRGERVSVNPSFSELTGINEDEAIGKSVLEENKLGDSFAKLYQEQIDLVKRTNETLEFEITGRREDEEVWFWVKLVPECGEAGQMISIISFGRDITKFKQTQFELNENSQLLQNVIDNIPQAIFWKNRDFVYLGCNRVFAEDAGLASPEEVIGKTDYEIPWEQQVKLYRGDDRLVIEHGKPKLNYEEPQTTPDGSKIWLKTNKVPMKDAEGTIYAVLGTYEDITERKQMEERLRESETGFRLLYNNTPAMLYSIDRKGKLVNVSDYWLSVMGYSREEVIGKKSTDFLTEESRTYATEVVLPEFMESGSCYNVEYQYVKKNGQIIDCILSAISEKDDQGNMLRSMAAITNITKRKQAERENERMLGEVKKFQGLLQSVLDSTPDWIFIKDLEHHYLMVNQGYANALHLSADDFIGKNDLELGFPEELVKGNPKKGIRGFWADDNLVVKSGRMQVYPEDPATIDGEVHTFHTIKSPLKDVGGKIWGVLAFARDVTEMKLKETKLIKQQFILEEAQRLGKTGSWEFDVVHNTRDWSAETFRIFEIDPGKITPSPDTFFKLVHPDDKEKIDKVYRELGRGCNDYEIEFRLLFPDGRVKYVIEHGMTHFDDKGNPLRYLGTVQDVTQWRETERELTWLKDEAEENSRLKSAFLAAISHEVRTPLNAIWGFSSLLDDDSFCREERREFIQLVVKSVSKLTRLVDNIIELSKIKSGRVEIKPERYNPEQLLKEQFNRLKIKSEETGREHLELKVAIESRNKGATFINDTRRIGQVFEILIDNALKFTSEGTITLGLRANNEKQVEFYVADTGIGISDEKRESIFNPFVQIEDTTTRSYGGLGIGLSVAQKLVRAMGGKLTLVSERDKGSTFSLVLPVKIKKSENGREIFPTLFSRKYNNSKYEE